MFEGFALETVETGEAAIRVRRGGSGPPVLLLHGYPQTHAMWHLVAPRLARDFTVVATDLRGYGDSSKPPTTADHEPYSKRGMARDQVAVMRALGFERFAVVGHDRGARVAYRMALDHPERVERLAVLDIVPTADAYRRTDMEFALSAWHWFLLPQPHDLPERLLAADPDVLLPRRAEATFAPEALAEYRRCLRDPATIHAICEDYRAGATLDFAFDEADRGVRRIACPVLVLWGGRGKLGCWHDVLAVWRAWAGDVRGRALDCGHHLAEEAPDETYRELRAFLASPAGRQRVAEPARGGEGRRVIDRARAERVVGGLHVAQAALYAGDDEEAVRTLLTEDIVWHVPGRNAIAGEHRGIDAVMRYFRRRRDLARRTFRMHPRELLYGGGDHVAALTDGTAVVDGEQRRWSTVGLYRLRGERVAECWLLPLDQAAFDEIWSS